MNAEAFREAGHALVEQIASFLTEMPEGPVTPAPLPSELKNKLPGTMPENGEDASALLHSTFELLSQNSLFNGHPRFWGYVTSSPSPMGMLADLMAATINSNGGNAARPVDRRNWNTGRNRRCYLTLDLLLV